MVYSIASSDGYRLRAPQSRAPSAHLSSIMASVGFLESQLASTVSLFAAAGQISPEHQTALEASTVKSIVTQIGNLPTLDLPMASRLYAAVATSGVNADGKSTLGSAIAQRVSQSVARRDPLCIALCV